MATATINSATGEETKTFDYLTDEQIDEKLDRAVRAFQRYRKTSFRRWRRRRVTVGKETWSTRLDPYLLLLLSRLSYPCPVSP